MGSSRAPTISEAQRWCAKQKPGEKEPRWLSHVQTLKRSSLPTVLVEGDDVLDAAEVPQHDQLLDLVCEWFAVEVEHFRKNQPFEVSNHVGEIVRPGTAVVAPHLVAKRNAGEPAAATVAEVRTEYSRKLRGKQLFQVLERFLNGARRGPRYNYDAQIEVALRYAGNPHPLEPIVVAVRAALA